MSNTTCHPQTDGQTEVTNQTLCTLLRAFIKPHAKIWDLLLPLIEFAYNKALSKATSHFPFKMVYGIDPLSPIDLTPQPLDQKPSANAGARVEEIQKLHELVKARIEKTNASDEAQANKYRRKMVVQPRELI